jgi:hypothetical protein
MKCRECGADVIPGAKFCHNCGFEIKTAHKFCTNCGSKLEPDDNFCSICGEPVRSEPMTESKPKVIKVSSEQKKQKRRKHVKQAPGSDKATKIIFYGAVMLAVFFMLIYFYITQQSARERSRPARREITSIRVPPEIEAKVYEVASKFSCGCGACNELPLEKCDCNSAIQEKNFIKELLLKGESVENVIIAVNERYGYLKPEYQDKYGPKLELRLK